MRAALLLLVVLLAGGCEKLARNMYDGARQRPLATAEPPPVAHTVPAVNASDQAALRAQAIPHPLARATLARGQERFEIYCAPCHGVLGDGDGIVVRRGFPRPPSYHADRLQRAPDRHFFDVITGGYGVMAPYGGRIGPADRWAIVAYIRALQRSQDAGLAGGAAQ